MIGKLILMYIDEHGKWRELHRYNDIAADGDFENNNLCTQSHGLVDDLENLPYTVDVYVVVGELKKESMEEIKQKANERELVFKQIANPANFNARELEIGRLLSVQNMNPKSIALMGKYTEEEVSNTRKQLYKKSDTHNSADFSDYFRTYYCPKISPAA